MSIEERTPEEKRLSDAWYHEGSVSAAAGILESIKRQSVVLTPQGRLTALRVEGASRLKEKGVNVPPRSKDKAYVPEPDRVMYAVHSTPVFNSNGYSTRTKGMAEGIAASGAGVVVVARSGYPWDAKVDSKKPSGERCSMEVGGIEYVHTPGGDLVNEPFDVYLQRAADSFVREARRIRPSVIVAASNHRTALPALIAARRVGVPFVYEVRGLWEVTELASRPHIEGTERFELAKNLETLVARESDRVLAITNQVADEIVRRGVSRERIDIVPNAVNIETFAQLPKDSVFLAKKELDPGIPTIGFAGSLVNYEGLEVLLDASGLLSRRNVDHQVVIAGSGGAETVLRAKAESLGLDNVHFLGRLPQSEIPRLMSVIDIVACPRLSTRVTQLVSPLKPLEAFASGKATILSNVEPHLDLAGERQERALLCEAGDANSLAVELEKLIADPELRASVGREARLWVVRQRQWSTIGRLVKENLSTAMTNYEGSASAGENLSDVTIAIIADEFTSSSLEGTVSTISLNREHWKAQLQSNRVDALFVESAWSGNDGQWRRGIGHYSEEESSDLEELLAYARQHRIPTIFWNKEDPVHFARFAHNAAKFDHVFTTDANMIPKYLELAGNRIKTAAALPFWAQPALHNPLPVDREFSETVAYAGTYYGDRYKQRSVQLLKLLSAAEDIGIDIYDRQASNPDSPYKFPPRYAEYVRGALPYHQVVKSYKTHIAHLNVNSVVDSPTMFSRRAVEIPASGGVVLSSEGRGITETLGSTIASSSVPDDLGAFLDAWASDDEERTREVWLQMRTIYRSHTATSTLLVMLRTAGIPVSGAHRATYALETDVLDESAVAAIIRQSYRPTAVVARKSEGGCVGTLEKNRIPVLSTRDELSDEIAFLGKVDRSAERTFYEDLLLPTSFGEWSFVGTDTEFSPRSIARVASSVPDQSRHLVNRQKPHDQRGVVMRLPMPDVEIATSSVQASGSHGLGPDDVVLFAGHDFKFIRAFMDDLEEGGVKVLVDRWESHSKHDEEVSEALLLEADVVFCEWGLGNARWYSRKIREDQRLIVRVHSQEIFLPFLSQIVHTNVDSYIFVGGLVRDAAVTSNGVPMDKTTIIPNGVDVGALDQVKSDEARFTLGFVGMVPRSKRLDRAIDLLEVLLRTDSRYRLRVKGKTWREYPWMVNRPEEIRYYEELAAKIAEINDRFPNAVVFDGYGDDMADWYRSIGVVVSTSEFESFHLTIADGAASGALPAVLAWPGADLIYPEQWLAGSIKQMADQIKDWNGDASEYKAFASRAFQKNTVEAALAETLVRSNT